MKRLLTRNSIDERLLYTYLATLVIGLVMVYSTSSIMAASRFGSHVYFLRQQFIWVVMSLVVVYVLYRIDLKRYAVYSAPALLLTLVLLALVFVMPSRNGSHRWLIVAGFSIQPSELFRFLLVAYLAFSLSNPKRDVAKLKQVMFPYMPIIGLGLVLIALEPDLGSVIVILLTVAGVMFLAGSRVKHMVLAALPGASLAAFMVFVLGYKKSRLLDYVNSVFDPLQGSYHVRQAALTLGSGGLFGTGLGEGRQKLFFLPYPHTDFIFAAIGEELGMVGLLVLLGLLVYMLWRGFKIAARQPDRFGFLLAAGMTWMLFVNISINIGVVTAILPVTGLPLPFISYGGSSLLMSSAAIGVLLSLSGRIRA